LNEIIDVKIFSIALIAVVVITQGCVCHMDDSKHPPRAPGQVLSSFERPLEEVQHAVKQVLDRNGIVARTDLGPDIFHGILDTGTVRIGITRISERWVQVKTEVKDKSNRPDTKKATDLDVELVRLLLKR
jgi:hypothetical protein